MNEKKRRARIKAKGLWMIIKWGRTMKLQWMMELKTGMELSILMHLSKVMTMKLSI
jgi:hypothetical protein